jgi:hypothetical protein
VTEINSAKKLSDWMKDKPRGWGELLSARCAFRVIPQIFHARTLPVWSDNNENLALLSFRLASLLALKFTKEFSATELNFSLLNLDTEAPAYVALKSLAEEKIRTKSPAWKSIRALCYAAEATTDVDAACLSSTEMSARLSEECLRSVEGGVFGFESVQVFWRALTMDCQHLLATTTEANVGLMEISLWHNLSIPDLVLHDWEALKSLLRRRGEDWQTWISWYEGLLGAGLPLQPMLGQTIASFSTEFWENGPGIVNKRMEEIWNSIAKDGLDSPVLNDTSHFSTSEWKNLDLEVALNQKLDEYFPVVYRNPNLLTIKEGFQNRRSIPDGIISNHLESLSDLLEDLSESWASHNLINSIPTRMLKAIKRLRVYSCQSPDNLNAVALARRAKVLKDSMKIQIASNDCLLTDDEIAYIKNIVIEAEEIQKAYTNISKFKREETENAAALAQEIVDNPGMGDRLQTFDLAVASTEGLDEVLQQPLSDADRPISSMEDAEKRSLIIQVVNKAWNIGVAITKVVRVCLLKRRLRLGGFC